MRWYDQVFLAIQTLALAVLSLLVLLLAAGWQDPLQALLAALGRTDGRLALAVLGALFFALSLRLLTLALVRRSGLVLVRPSPLGEIRIALPAIESLVVRAGRQLDGVRDLRARIVPGPDRLDVELRAWVSVDAAVPELCDRLQQVVRQRVQSLVGAEVGQVRVLVRGIGEDWRRRRVE